MKIVKIIPTKANLEQILNIAPAKNYIPEWYKKSPQKIKPYENFSLSPENPISTTATYKICSPFLDALTHGYIFYLSKDIEVVLNNDGSPHILWRVSPDPISWHTNNQWEGFNFSDDYHNFIYKWSNYFIIKTPKHYSTLFTHPHNRFDLPFQTLSGVVDTDKYNVTTQFPFILKKDFSGIIEAGTPVAQINFFKRTHWIKNLLKYDEGFVKTAHQKHFSKINRSYKNQTWEKKQYE
jgi:hypothetical protein